MPGVLSVPAVTKADLVEEIWAEVARHQTSAEALRQAAGASALVVSPSALPAGPAEFSLPELLALDGDAFVHAAYQTLLRRAPDEAGTELMLGGLADGHDKIVLLGRLRRSAEGRAVGHRLPGLGRRFMAHRIYRVPALGPALRMSAAVLRRTGLSRLLSGRTAPATVSPAQMHAHLAAYAAVADGRRDLMERQLGEQQLALDLATRRFALLQTALEDANRQSVEAARAFTRQLGAEHGKLKALQDQATGAQDRLGQLEALLSDGLAERVAAATTDLRMIIQGRMQHAEAAASRAGQAVADQERQLAAIIQTLRDQPAMGRVAAALDGSDDHALDALYVAFEDVFRGSRADIKQRQRFYLPTLAQAGAGTPRRPVLDVGCGRGEFLELLKEQGLTARGVDANRAMAGLCEGFGLDVVVDDAVSYLSRQDTGSLGAVTGFHIVEHLPFKTMVRLFDEVLRALAPGGVMIFETPNPANLMVGAYTFYLDPTHIRPLPGQMMEMIARARGFDPVGVTELHPTERRFTGGDPVLRAELDALFHGPQDYALIARKP